MWRRYLTSDRCSRLGVARRRRCTATCAPRRRTPTLLKQKVATITAHGEKAIEAAAHDHLTENEVNSYLAFDAKEQLPAGVVEPSVTTLGPGRVSGRAVVDLDAVRKAKNPTSLLDPMNYLIGRLPVTATGMLKTSNGVGRFELESASVGGVPIPKMLLQEIVSYYSRTPREPGRASASTIRLRCRRASARSKWSGVKP